MTAPVIQSLIFDPPLLNPSTPGLYGATTWTENVGPSRFLAEGVKIRPWNYGGADAFGIWDEPWCATPGSDPESLKTGVRPDMDPDPFLPVTVWAFDECDPTTASQAEVQSRVQQILRLEEQTAVEQSFAARMSLDVAVLASAATLREAVSYLEGEIAKTNTVGFIHAGAQWATIGGGEIVLSSGTGLRTILGNRWVFGGGYVDGLNDVLVATSQVFGWRDAIQVRPVLTAQQNNYAVVAERSIVVGYEKLIAAVQITDTSV